MNPNNVKVGDRFELPHELDVIWTAGCGSGEWEVTACDADELTADLVGTSYSINLVYSIQAFGQSGKLYTFPQDLVWKNSQPANTGQMPYRMNIVWGAVEDLKSARKETALPCVYESGISAEEEEKRWKAKRDAALRKAFQ